MSWLEKPRWLRWGTMAALVPLIITALMFLAVGLGANIESFFLLMILLYFGESMPFGVILAVCVWFGVGAAIGWFVDRRKSPRANL